MVCFDVFFVNARDGRRRDEGRRNESSPEDADFLERRHLPSQGYDSMYNQAWNSNSRSNPCSFCLCKFRAIPSNWNEALVLTSVDDRVVVSIYIEQTKFCGVCIHIHTTIYICSPRRIYTHIYFCVYFLTFSFSLFHAGDGRRRDEGRSRFSQRIFTRRSRTSRPFYSSWSLEYPWRTAFYSCQ